MKSGLYFIALVPNREIREQVKKLKEAFRTDYGAGHALKSPAHITLQMPFKRVPALENDLCESLEQFAGNQKGFSVGLKGFGCFEPRVIYLKVTGHEPIQKLQQDLKAMLAEKTGFTPDELTTKIHPHMTLATRDLSEEAFYKAWPAYEHRKFEATFPVSGIFLLKHNGKSWDIFREFSFKPS